MVEKEVDNGRFVRWFSELNKGDVKIAGVKGANLGELYGNKFPVPAGFVVTSGAFKNFIEKNNLGDYIKNILNETNYHDFSALERSSGKIRHLIENAKMPAEMERSILEAYDVLDVDGNFSGVKGGALDILRTGHEPPFVAVRSSPVSVAESERENSFAGQHDSFLNVKGESNLIKYVKRAFGSLFSSRAIYYRKDKSIHDFDLAVVVQRMIDSDKSGVILPRNSLGQENRIIIEAIFGLGKGLVNGSISPDYYVVSRDLELKEQKIADKKIAFTRNSSGKTEAIQLNEEISKREVLTGHEIKMLTQLASRLEEHFDKSSQGIEFAISRDEIFVLQTNNDTGLQVSEDDTRLDGNVLFSGRPISQGVGVGMVKLIESEEDLKKFQKGNVAVLDYIGSDISNVLQKASAVVSSRGGATSSVGVVLREKGIPVVSCAGDVREKLKDGQIVTVDGFSGRVIEGEGEERQINVQEILPTKSTKIKIVVDLPDYAKKAAESGAKGVGVVKLENLTAGSGKHPEWFIKNDKLDEYISLLHDNLEKVVDCFEEVWVRLSSLRSDKYQNLEGAPLKSENNPRLGDHGVRFSLRNQEFLEAELKAVKDLADQMAGKKFGVTLPRVTSLREFKDVKRIASEVGLPNNVKLGVMIDTPASVQIINDLCESGVEFVNISLSDLTQHTLVVDKDNEHVKETYDEMSPAILNSIRYVLRRCKRHGVESSIYHSKLGEKMIEFLVSNGVDSICAGPGDARKVSEIIAGMESSSEYTKEFKFRTKDKKDLENIDQEDLILEALEDPEEKQDTSEYSPALEKGKSEEIPSLNEAIPLSSQDLVEKQESTEINEEIQQPLVNEEIEVISDKSEGVGDGGVVNDGLEGEEVVGNQVEDAGQVGGAMSLFDSGEALLKQEVEEEINSGGQEQQQEIISGQSEGVEVGGEIEDEVVNDKSEEGFESRGGGEDVGEENQSIGESDTDRVEDKWELNNDKSDMVVDNDSLEGEKELDEIEDDEADSEIVPEFRENSEKDREIGGTFESDLEASEGEEVIEGLENREREEKLPDSEIEAMLPDEEIEEESEFSGEREIVQHEMFERQQDELLQQEVAKMVDTLRAQGIDPQNPIAGQKKEGSEGEEGGGEEALDIF